MRAALRLRLLETRRRGGPWFLLLATAAVLAVSLFGGETVGGRYGVATDVAATLSYVAAVFLGAFPLALDRERRRSYLPSASPVAPWTWALGNAVGAAIPVLVLAVCLFGAAALGAAARGGIETHRVTKFDGSGSLRLPAGPRPRRIEVREGTTAIRFVAHTYLVADDAIGTADAARIGVDGRVFEVHHNRPITVPVQNNPVLLRNRSPDFAVAIDIASFRALYEPRPFAPNALLAALPPALGAAALAALGTAAGAHLGAPIAALLLTVLLMLSSMRGFLLDMISYEGSLRRDRTEAAAGHEHHGHSHARPPIAADSPARAFAKGAVTALLDLVPPVGDLDRTGDVAIGEWIGLARVPRGSAYVAMSLVLAALLGGIGVHLRRTP